MSRREDNVEMAQGSITVDITREQIECWAGRPLTDDEVQRLDDMIPNSSIPEAIGTIVAERLPVDPTDWRYNKHRNPIGNWCPWSDKQIEPDTDLTDDNVACPAACPDSRIEHVDYTVPAEETDESEPLISAAFSSDDIETLVRTLAEIVSFGDWRDTDPDDDLSQRQKELADRAWELLRREREAE